MATVRIFFQNKRVTTAKEWKTKFLQVYPVVKEFENRTEWSICWQKVLSDSIKMVFDTETPVTAAASVSLPPSPSPLPSTKDWSYRRELTYTAPAGKYYIGDLCYALYENIYDNIFGGRDYSSGIYTKGSSFFVVDNTAYGDGAYRGTDGYEYLVDAGIIGICSADLIDPKNTSVGGGKIHTFTEPVEIRFKGGVFRFNSGYTYLKINTEGDEEEE